MDELEAIMYGDQLKFKPPYDSYVLQKALSCHRKLKAADNVWQKFLAPAQGKIDAKVMSIHAFRAAFPYILVCNKCNKSYRALDLCRSKCGHLNCFVCKGANGDCCGLGFCSVYASSQQDRDKIWSGGITSFLRGVDVVEEDRFYFDGNGVLSYNRNY